MWNDVVGLFREYMGTGLIVIWFLVSLIYLLIKEKRKHIRILSIYVPVILLLLFFNPLLANAVYEMADGEIYYRILWLLPITVVIAFAIVEVMVSGGYIYSNPYFHEAQNWYHMPQSVVDICDAIEVEGREVRAVFPVELLQYVRQYSPVVCMPYGREITVDRWNILNELYDAMEAEVVDAERLTALTREQECVYIVLPEDKKVNGELEAYAFELFTRVEGYVVYKDATVNLTYFLEE